MGHDTSHAEITNVESLRLRVTIRGAVQSVGFRPFIYRLATELGLAGWVNNSPQGVFIEVEGGKERLDGFLLRIEKEKPSRSFIQSLESSFLDPKGYPAFEIRESDDCGEKVTLVLPDISVCPDCLRDVFDPGNRRYLYPFTNCTNCGPRFSIIEALPYDRANTTMKRFVMCDECSSEYASPLDRRFHAQPNACPKCGPHLELWDEEGRVRSSRRQALLGAADAIREGRIVAVKGLGGFHLVVNARSDEAVNRLRDRKRREEKPFALMFPSLEMIKEDCEVSDVEERLLLSPESPIVLLRLKKTDPRPASLQFGGNQQSIAPGNPYLGVMLPYTPLHHLLMAEFDFPIVATSGNLSDEPICVDECEAVKRLDGVADLFLIHDRPIARHVDDSIARVIMGREMVLRRARGYAPLPVHFGQKLPALLATGAHLKNAVAISAGDGVFVSQHIGDLESLQAFEAFRRVISDFERLYEVQPESVACDAHPDYISTKFAEETGLPAYRVQHHLAHVVSCMAENEIDGPALGVAWDGTGYGDDGTIWGGEFLLVDGGSYQRVARLRAFRLPGGENAVREPRRAAIGLLYEKYGDELFTMDGLAPIRAFTLQERSLLKQMLKKRINSPLTSSVGRLFDAVAAVANLRQQARFEGQAAMELEFAVDDFPTEETYSMRGVEPEKANQQTALVIDWEPMVTEIIDDVNEGLSINRISAKFHNTLAEMIVAVARRVGEERVALSGGCFQNKYLTERAARRLQSEGFRPYWHQRVPPNDGGIALGQLVAAARSIVKTGM